MTKKQRIKAYKRALVTLSTDDKWQTFPFLCHHLNKATNYCLSELIEFQALDPLKKWRDGTFKWWGETDYGSRKNALCICIAMAELDIPLPKPSNIYQIT